jgi:cell wall-associated NlpC family hydrolase
MEDLDTSQNDYLKPASNGIPCTLNALKEGKNVKVTAVVDGLKVKCYVYVSDPQLSDEFIAIAKGSSDNLPISGLSEKYSDTPVIKTKKQSIITVGEDGTITAKKIGSVDVSVEVDGTVFQVTVAVGKAKAVKAFNEAKKALGLPYSQEKRMESGYRDCSSFIWRAYKVVGQKMGVTGSWAPTAAAQAYYYDTNGKTIYTTAADASKLHLGDLIFFTYSSNGRYKNIGHVAMYVGNGYMIHASASAGKVTYGKYEYSKDRVVMIARPF